MENNDKDFDQKRDGVRISDSFPIYFKIISREDFEEKSSFYIDRRTANRPAPLRHVDHVHSMDWASLKDDEDYNPSFIKVLSYLDKKMDMIISRQEEMLKNFDSKPREKSQFIMGESIDLSWSGLKIFTDKEIEKETILELTIEPIVYPTLLVVALGKIIKIEPIDKDGKTGFEISTEFVAINEYDRDELIKYIFKRQRESIASQKLADD